MTIDTRQLVLCLFEYRQYDRFADKWVWCPDSVMIQAARSADIWPEFELAMRHRRIAHYKFTEYRPYSGEQFF